MPRTPPRPGFLERPYEAGDTIPAPVTTELDSPEAWEAWRLLHEGQQAQFAPTLPMEELPPREQDPRYAETQPAALAPAAGKGRR